MKTRSVAEGLSNIAAIVKARRSATATEHENLTFTQIVNEVTSNAINANSNVNTATDNVNTIGNASSGGDKKTMNKPINRTMWSPEDKTLFFTALKMYGKNFNEISRFLTSRSSRLSASIGSKSKEQVRLFYNRTWNNIKPYLKLPTDLPQSVQEMYGLINYAVFRTRIKKKLNARLGEKLNEMVLKGSTVVKCNGKRIPLHTPVCPALKRLNNIRAPEQEFQIPDDVVIELKPRNHVTEWRVLEVHQNPKMRLKVSVNRQLSDVISFVSNKFKSAMQMIRETLSLPIIDPPKLHIRLHDDAKLYKEIVIQEVSKPKFNSVNLASYCENFMGQPTTGKENDNSQQSNFNVTTNDSTIINFEEMQKKLVAGIGIEEARNIKILALYIGLGCPSTINFLYEYLHPTDMETAHNCVSNGLRRLIHLSKTEFLENKAIKEHKSRLEMEIDEMEEKLNDMKRQLDKIKEDNEIAVFETTICSNAGNLTNSFCSTNGSSGQNTNPIIFKRQQEAIQQFIDDLPNKNNVIMKKVEYNQSHNSINSVKHFNQNRRRQKQNNITTAVLLKVPLPNQQEPSSVPYASSTEQQNDPTTSSIMALHRHPMVSNDIFINQYTSNGSNADNLLESQTTSGVAMMDFDNTSESLQSFLSDMVNLGQTSNNGIQYTGFCGDHPFLGMPSINDLSIPDNEQETRNADASNDTKLSSFSQFV